MTPIKPHKGLDTFPFKISLNFLQPEFFLFQGLIFLFGPSDFIGLTETSYRKLSSMNAFNLT